MADQPFVAIKILYFSGKRRRLSFFDVSSGIHATSFEGSFIIHATSFEGSFIIHATSFEGSFIIHRTGMESLQNGWTRGR